MAVSGSTNFEIDVTEYIEEAFPKVILETTFTPRVIRVVHDLLPPLRCATRGALEHEVELLRGLEGVDEVHDEGVGHRLQHVALGLRVFHLATSQTHEIYAANWHLELSKTFEHALTKEKPRIILVFYFFARRLQKQTNTCLSIK